MYAAAWTAIIDEAVIVEWIDGNVDVAGMLATPAAALATTRPTGVASELL